jgi:hypothetical protein
MTEDDDEHDAVAAAIERLPRLEVYALQDWQRHG